MAQIHELPALDLAAAIRSGQVSPTEVADHTLRRIESLDQHVGAFIHVAADRALDDARAAEATLAEASSGPGGAPDHRDLPPFLGVPVPIKDLNQVAGLPMRMGSAAFADNVAQLDDGIVSLLADAGTTMVGKTTTPEFGMPPYTEPDVGPTARTPWDLDRSAGGSSGGAGAAVAAGLVPAAQGSDGGGSIRIPASACGLVGLLPTRGRVSPGPYQTDGPGLGRNGVLTRTVRDTAALLDVLAVPRAGDIYRAPEQLGTFLAACDTPPARLRVGVLREPISIGTDVHPEALAAVDRAVTLLEGMGHETVEVGVPFAVEDWEAFQPVWATGAAAAPLDPAQEELLVPLTRLLRERGKEVTGVEYASAITSMHLLTRRTAQVWAGVDVILSPTLSGPPAPVGSMRDDADPWQDFLDQRAFTPWTSTWNITGAAAISLPLHRARVDDDGPELPFGVHLGGKVGSEALLLGLAAALEEADPWPHVAPAWERVDPR
ncbi:amidase [Georgenia sp. Z1491]|uniref:amidase n=1 Tax=Georgenia sp. Z1491 TaxID=3416707 RepID=UPI003CF6281C